MEKSNKMYCSSYGVIKTNGCEIFPDCDYFSAVNDEEAIEIAKSKALKGVDYDEGHFEVDLLSVCRVDPEMGYEDVETIWF